VCFNWISSILKLSGSKFLVATHESSRDVAHANRRHHHEQLTKPSQRAVDDDLPSARLGRPHEKQEE
jgi:hypothetical protein